jgi:UDP-perosamine 4-acetyltransferase
MSGILTRVVVLGAGGHARVCLDALMDDPGLDVVGCVSADGVGVHALPVPVLGANDDVARLAADEGCTHAFVAIGDITARTRVTMEVLDLGLALVTAVSRFAMVSSRATLGDGSLVCAGSVVNAAAEIGRGVIVNTNASVDHDCRIGQFSHVAPGSVLGGEVVVGAGVFVGLGVRVLPRVTIGDGAVIGAGAVVVRDVPAGATAVGIPARVR